MRVTEIWRYPVKSMLGESLPEAAIAAHGVVGDRGWSVRDLASGRTLTGRREPQLLFASATLVDDEVVITLPDGAQTNSDADLSSWLGRDVELVRAAEDRFGTYEIDLHENDEWITWDGPTGSFHDSGRTMVSLASVATFGDWAPQRFRKNVLLDGDARAEDTLVGSRVALGAEVQLDVQKQVDRCVMVTRPQPGLDRDLGVLTSINADNGGNLGIGAVIAAPGVVAVGDELAVVGTVEV